MKDVTAKLLAKAERSIAAGASALPAGHLEASASRAYYAMFYTAEALLNERSLRFRKHAGVHAAYGEHFAKPALLDPQYHRWLLAAYNKRITADYGIDAELSAAEVELMLTQAREFLATAIRFLQTEPPPQGTAEVRPSA